MQSSQNSSAPPPITPLVLIIGALLISLSFGAGYVIGQQNPTLDALTRISSEINAEVASHLKRSSEDNSKKIKPHDQSALIPLPPNHPAIPQVDHRGHPTFDCSTMSKALPPPDRDDVLTIKSLHQDREHLQGKSIKARALIVGVYPQIMGTNWYHLCDAPKGRVFVVSSSQVAPRGAIVHVEGELKLNHEVGGVYTFPLFVQEAKLEGDNVQDASQSPQGVMKL